MTAVMRSSKRILLLLAATALLVAGWVAVTPERADASTVYQLRAEHSGLCVTTNGLFVRQDSCAINTATNVFVLQPSDNGSYRIVKPDPDRKCLAGKGSILKPAYIIAESCSGDLRQQWWVNGYGDETYEFVNRRTELCLDVYGGYLGPGIALIDYTCYQDYNQRFRLMEASGALSAEQ
jgi:hypothetical protein